jgi:hypothetical protein
MQQLNLQALKPFVDVTSNSVSYTSFSLMFGEKIPWYMKYSAIANINETP